MLGWMISLCCLSLSVNAQYNRIEDIKSDSDALNYIIAQNYSPNLGPQWKFFHLNEGDEWNDFYNFNQNQIAKINDHFKFSKWAKADLNQDGIDDFIVSGYIAKSAKDWKTATFKLLIFFSQSSASRVKTYVEMNVLPTVMEKYPAYFNVLTINGKSYLELISWRNNILPGENNLPYSCDTLGINHTLGGFNNYYEKGLSPIAVSKLIYKYTTDDKGSYVSLTLSDKEKKGIEAIITSKDASIKNPDINTTRIRNLPWAAFDSLARSINNPVLILNTDQHDQQLQDPVDISFFYVDGTSHTIHVNRQDASFSLNALFYCCDAIIQNYYNRLEQQRENAQQLMDFFPFNDF